VGSRAQARASTIGRALLHLGLSHGQRKRPENPRRILIAHHLLLGDTLALTPLLAKLRSQFPDAEIVMTTPTAIAPLYEKRPYGVIAWSFNPRDANTLTTMLSKGGFDLAIIPGNNRYSWLAAALKANWIVAHLDDTPSYKSWPVDEAIPYPDKPAAWGDVIADLIDGPAPLPFDPKDWPAPTFTPFALPEKPYAVLHIGASTSLKLWDPHKWRALANNFVAQGVKIAWSGGKNETRIVNEIDPSTEYQSYAGSLDLAQLWQLIDNAEMLICPDTGVAHLGRIIGTPTIALFGPGSNVLSGAGNFWRNSCFLATSVVPFPCRNQHRVFNREVPSIQLCKRTTKQCADNLCMQAISVDTVTAKIALAMKSGKVES
jgi:ADP-heptose:LPS heptosyltransferase